MNDLVFDYGWRKAIPFIFQGKETQIELVFSAMKGQDLSEIQTQILSQLTELQAEYQRKVSELLAKYIQQKGIKQALVKPRTLLIQRNGSIGLLCDCNWDEENGIAIVIQPEEYVTIQDDFL